MKFSDVEAGIVSVLANAPEEIRKRYCTLFRHPGCHSLFQALDNELFLSGITGGERPGLLVASSVRGEGKTTIALCLAILTCVLDSGRRVLLVDADTGKGNLAASLGMREGLSGLYEWFNGQAQMNDCVHATALPNLCVTPLRADPRAVTRFQHESFAAFMEQAFQDFDLVIVDSSSGDGNRQAVALARIVRNALLVIQYNGPTRHQIAKLKDELERADARIVGSILNQRKYEIPRLFYGAGG